MKEIIYELSENQKNIWYASGGNLEIFYHETEIAFKNTISRSKLLDSIKKVVDFNEVLNYRIYKDDKFQIPFQYKLDYSIDVFDVNYVDFQYFDFNEFNFGYNPVKDSPIRFLLCLKDENVLRMKVRAFSFWLDAYSFDDIIFQLSETLKNKELVKENIITFEKYCGWQNELLSNPEEEAVHFFSNYDIVNANNKFPFILNSDQQFKNKRINVYTLLGEEYSKLKKWANDNNTCLEYILLSNWINYLEEFIQEDFTIGYTPYTRNYEELVHTIGCVDKILPLNIPDKNIKDRLELVNSIKNEIELVKEWSDYFSLERSKFNMPQSRYFSFCFEYKEVKYLDGMNWLSQDSVCDLYDLKLTCLDFGDRIEIDLNLNQSKLDEKATQVICEQLKSIFNHSLIEFQFELSSFENEILKKSNNTISKFDNKNNVINLFESIVATSPNTIAIHLEDKNISYGELDDYANQLANYMSKDLGIKAEDGIAISMKTSEWYIISILAILKLRAYYIPIDENNPKERIEYIIKDSECSLLITDDYLLNKYKLEFENILIPSDIDDLSNQSTDFFTVIEENDITYCIYTSGSTGKPKGCIITHENLSNYINWANDYYFGDNKTGNFGLVTSMSFDLTITSIFSPLTRGKSITIPKGDDILVKLEKVLQDKNVDSLKLTPSHIQLIAQLGIVKSNLQILICGGEQLKRNHVKDVKKLNDNIRLINEYGPTETTVGCIAKNIDLSIDKDILIGKPIANTFIDIVNENGDVLPIGKTGEIIISGDSVSKEYLNNKELTDQKFFKNLLGNNSYKTGDLGRWLPNGEIEFIGRIDDQIKINGYRIEVKEIEEVLGKKEEVKDCIVLISEEKEMSIIAFVKTEMHNVDNELRRYLLSKLPQYMIPNLFIELQRFPLTNNGKIDKEALLCIANEFVDKVPYIKPSSTLEKEITEIWNTILEKEKIGINDNFFQIGGHSIKAIKLLNILKKHFEKNVTIEDIFSNPTIRELSLLINQSDKKEYIGITKVKELDSYDVSDAQRRLWVLSQFEGGSVAYNMPSTIILNGNFDIEKFEKAIYAVINRHEILRTVFRENGEGEILQIIKNSEDFNFELVYKDFKEDQNLAKLYIKQDSYVPFDLENGPLLRAAMLKISEDEFVFYYNMHHIISDGWSMEILSQDVLAYYEAFKNDENPKLKKLPIQYKDYASWQLGQLDTDTSKVSKDFWLDKLSGELPILDLPTNKNRPIIKTYDGSLLTTYIDKDITSFIKNYSQVNGGSLFTGLLAVLNVLLYKYTSEKDVIIGTVVAGRDHIDLKDQIGFYVNTLALRNQINPEKTFNSFYSELKTNTLAAYNHQMYPFDRLIEDLNLDRDTSRSVLFDVMLVLQNNRENQISINLSEEELESLRYTEKAISKFDLEFSFEEIGDYLSFNVIYNSDIYDKEIISQLIKHYKQLLKTLQNNCDVTIGEIDYLSLKEKHELLEVFNTTRVTYPNDKTVLDLFSKQVEKTPDAIAVIYEDVELTYKELDIKSNQLAHYLVDHYSIAKEDLIGIKLERSEWMIISIFGILKTGGAYVPIDPNYPEDRITFIENDTKCKVCIDEVELKKFRTLEYPSKSIELSLDLSNLAYVIYTSGTTGNPKGVMIEHSSLVNLIYWFTDFFNISSSTVAIQLTDISFDPSVEDIFGTLTKGGTYHALPKEKLLNIEELRDYITKNKINILNYVPKFLYELLADKPKIASLNTIVSGGEVLSEYMKNSILNLGYTLYNNYGPTEITVDALSSKMTEKPVNIGKPITNCMIMVLNEEDALIPIGCIGELCISGKGLSRGYLGQEILTLEKFVKNPFIEGQRMYKTGDLVKWLPDGNIEFIGRKDDQVKIQGYRIELGEIESRLSQMSHIESNVVVVREKEEGQKELIAYCISNEELSFEYMRNKLKEVLPDYMLPSYFVQIEEFPITSNGKIDKKNLPDPDKYGMFTGVDYMAPSNEIEEKLVAIWEEVLKREKIGVDDNFFELGGSSIKGIKIMSKLQKEFDVKINFGVLFKTPTIKNLSFEISQIISSREKNQSREIVDSTII